MALTIHRGTIHGQTEVSCSLQDAWDFISRPENLNLITPPDLQFVIKSDVPSDMYDGLLIEYQVKLPLLGQSPWVSEIKHIRPGLSFVDEQRIGPYALWYHYHEIKEQAGKVLFIDKVRYKLPLGFLGDLFVGWKVRRDLRRIFTFRDTALKSHFEEEK